MILIKSLGGGNIVLVSIEIPAQPTPEGDALLELCYNV